MERGTEEWTDGIDGRREREREREREKDKERDREGQRRGRKREEKRTTKPARNTKFAPPQKKGPADKPLTSADKR